MHAAPIGHPSWLMRAHDTPNGHQDVMYQKANCGYVAEVPLYFLYICKLYRCIVSQKKEYTGCTELTVWLYSYSILRCVQYMYYTLLLNTKFRMDRC